MLKIRSNPKLKPTNSRGVKLMDWVIFNDTRIIVLGIDSSPDQDVLKLQ